MKHLIHYSRNCSVQIAWRSADLHGLYISHLLCLWNSLAFVVALYLASSNAMKTQKIRSKMGKELLCD